MDFLHTRLPALKRSFPYPAILTGTGGVPNKRNWIDGKFKTLNVSIILKGRGTLSVKGKTYQISPPCAFLQRPGIHCKYGPENKAGWTEIFLIFKDSSQMHFKLSGILPDNLWYWQIENLPKTKSALEELQEALRNSANSGSLDRIDRLAERVVLESRLPLPFAETSLHQSSLARIRERLQTDFKQPISLEDLAEEEGLSYATFRRIWHLSMEVSPKAFLQEARMRESRKLLSSTQMPIAEIAHACGYEDALYFSRRFSKVQGCSPSEYRRQKMGFLNEAD